MNRNVTQDQIIKFVYGELSFKDTASLYDKIDQEPESLKDLEDYAALKLELNKLNLKPSKDLEKKILAFSAEF